MARKGAPPVAEEATAAVGQPLALADRSAGREGLAATRTIGPYKKYHNENNAVLVGCDFLKGALL